jgi:hypothetical protein
MGREKIRQHVDAIQRIDRLLPPHETIEVEEVGAISPSLSRYIMRAIEIDKLFGIDGRHIAELGGGWGGLCAAIHALYKPASYLLCDIPRIAATQGEIAAYLGLSNVSAIHDLTQLHGDLFVSDYAFSELTDSAQERYSFVFPRFRSGTMICPAWWGENYHRRVDFHANLRRWTGQSVDWSGDSSHYRSLAYHCSDVRCLDAYLWNANIPPEDRQ